MLTLTAYRGSGKTGARWVFLRRWDGREIRFDADSFYWKFGIKLDPGQQKRLEVSIKEIK